MRIKTHNKWSTIALALKQHSFLIFQNHQFGLKIEHTQRKREREREIEGEKKREREKEKQRERERHTERERDTRHKLPSISQNTF